MALNINSPTLDQDIADMFRIANVNKWHYEWKHFFRRCIKFSGLEKTKECGYFHLELMEKSKKSEYNDERIEGIKLALKELL